LVIFDHIKERVKNILLLNAVVSAGVAICYVLPVLGMICMRTDKQTYMLITILRSSTGGDITSLLVFKMFYNITEFYMFGKIA